MELKIFKIKLKEGDLCEKTSKDASPHERSKESSSYFKIVKECAKKTSLAPWILKINHLHHGDLA